MAETDLQQRFEKAAQAIQALPRRPDNAALLRVYALYKQATAGDVAGSRPGIVDVVGRAKYDAWAALKGKPREQAMQEYVDLADQLAATGGR
jgi:diazepam-binding inhibitor (GABA receptor modulating acyl-CoA-binding protein)